MTYQIQSKLDGQWDAANVGDSEGNRFDTEAEAEAEIVELRGLGPDFAAGEYRVVELAEARITSTDALATLRRCRQHSAASWETAVETAGPEYDGGSAQRASVMQSLADACAAEYDSAIDVIREQGPNWQSVARRHLEAARRYESEGGDSSDAVSALDALEEYIEALDALEEYIEALTDARDCTDAID